MNVFIFFKLALYYLLHLDVSVATQIGDKALCFNNEYASYCLSYFGQDIGKQDTQVDEAIIVVHGILKDANKMCSEVGKGIANEKVNRTALICPQFLTQADIKKYGLKDNNLFWSFEGWDNGNYAQNGQNKISSFSMIDTLIQRVSSAFPNLKNIKVIGFSAGGQFVQRYAALTTIDDSLRNKNISITYILVSPSSYLYLDATRPSAYMANAKSCSNYNQYKYGLDGVAFFSNEPADQVRQRYQFKKIIYVVGENDNSRYNIFLDKSCAANMQGLNRKERLANYYNYLVNLYGPSVKNYQQIYIVKSADHHFSGKLISALDGKT